MREIKFYKNTSGQCPVQDFIRALPTKEREKLLWGLRFGQRYSDGAARVF